ncbi:MAG: TolC family protein [Bryobacteraceae bacterium]|nr:TolC family protein [Bryobacteraceae bacterium]
MSSLRLWIGVAAFLSVAPARLQPADPATVHKLLDIAVQNNGELSAVRQRMEEARGLLRQAGVRPPPALDISGYSGSLLGTAGEQQFSVGVSREFESAGKRSKRLRAAEYQLAIATAEYDERVRQLRYEILARLADYAAEERRLRVLDSMLELNRQSLELTRVRVEKGDAAQLEQNLIVVEIGRVEAQRSVASGRMEAARSDISRLIGVAPGETWTAAARAVPSIIPLEGLASKAAGQRPDLRLLRFARQFAEAEISLAEAEARPNVTASVSYSRVTSRFDDQLGLNAANQLTPLRDRDDLLQVGISIPLFFRNRNLGNIEAAAARTKAAQHRLEYLERAIPLEVEAAWRQFESSRTALASLDGQAIPLSESNLDVIRQAYQLGQLRLLDVLAEQRRALDLQLTSIDLQAELRRSLAELEKAVGGPLQ